MRKTLKFTGAHAWMPVRHCVIHSSSMVEHGTVNADVVGSSPTCGAIRLASLAHGLQPAKRVECPERSRRTLMCFVYIIRTRNNQLYIGHTQSLERRELEHRFHAHGAKFLKAQRNDFSVVYSETFETRTEAMRRERQLKGWTRAKKEALIARDLELLKKL